MAQMRPTESDAFFVQFSFNPFVSRAHLLLLLLSSHPRSLFFSLCLSLFSNPNPIPQSGLLPLEVGTLVDCRWRDGTYYTARVIERRPTASSGAAAAALRPSYPPPSKLNSKGAAGAAAAASAAALAAASKDPSVPKPKPEEWEYYVHYLKFNRRMDEWASLEQLDLSTVDTGDVETTGPDGKKKKRAGAAADDHDDEHHAEFDPHALREHEEFTKVKNVERIELGRWEMETWYFSPLPPEFNDCKKLYFAEFDLTVRRLFFFSSFVFALFLIFSPDTGERKKKEKKTKERRCSLSSPLSSSSSSSTKIIKKKSKKKISSFSSAESRCSST